MIPDTKDAQPEPESIEVQLMRRQLEEMKSTRIATQVLAWVICIVVALQLIIGVVIGVQIIHAMNPSSSSSDVSNCFSVGGTDPSC
jgi:hypothetical protein